jgi:hypothetical protein
MKKDGQRMTWGLARTTQVVLLAVLMLGTRIALQASDRQLGDIFVAIGNGSYQVYHNNVLAVDSPTIVDNAGGGATAGCGFDLTYHVFTTNGTFNNVFRHKIDDPQNVLQSISVVGAVGGQPTSIAFDSLGNSYVGNATGNGLIGKYGPSGTLLQTLPVGATKLKGGSPWIDLSPNAQTLYFTNGTKNINQFNVSSSNVTTFASISGATIFAIRVLPTVLPDGTTAPLGGDLLVAAGSTIQLFNSSGTSIKTYTVSGETNFQVLTLDPDGATFLAGNPTTHNVYRFNLVTGVPDPVVINTGAGGPSGLCAYGAFSAAQPQPITVSTTLTQASPTFDAFVAPPSNAPTVTVGRPVACPAPPATPVCNEFTSTLFNLSSSVTATATLQYLQIDSAAGASDTGLPCLVTSLDSLHCEVFSLSLGLPDNLIPQHDLAIFSIQGTVSPPPTSPYANPVGLENEVNDVTDFVFHGSTRIGTSCVTPPCNSTFTVHEQAIQVTNATSCGYTSPLPNSSFNQGRGIPFKFSAASSASACPTGPFLTNLTPELVIVQLDNLPNNTSNTAAPHLVAGTVKGQSGLPLFYRLSGTQWVLNFDSSSLQGCAINGVPTSCNQGGVPTHYLATTFDATQPAPLIPAFNFFAPNLSEPVTFTLR